MRAKEAFGKRSECPLTKRFCVILSYAGKVRKIFVTDYQSFTSIIEDGLILDLHDRQDML